MVELIKRSLDKYGYVCEPIDDNLIQLFLDCAENGVFLNLNYDEAKEMVAEGDITIEKICAVLLS
jgi:hypothetical protein